MQRRGCCGNGEQLRYQAAQEESQLLGAGLGSPCYSCSVSWTRGLGGEWGAELREWWRLYQGRRPSQWSGLNMRGMRTGWGIPSTSSSLSQGSLSFPDPISPQPPHALSPHPSPLNSGASSFMAIPQTTCVHEEQASARRTELEAHLASNF